MTDFEDRLRGELQIVSRDPDAAFVCDIDRKIAAYENRRVVWLTLAIVVALGLLVVAAFGMSMLASTLAALAAWPEFSRVRIPANVLRIAGPTIGLVLLATLLAPAVYSRR